MTDPTESARDDLAFVRALVTESGRAQDTLGKGLLAGGLCYGGQCAFQAAFAAGVPGPMPLQLAVGILPTVIFIVLITRISARDRKRSSHGIGTRAINAAFGAAGLAALTTAAIFAFLAWKTQNVGTWLLHPMMVCVVQGTVWYIAFAIRRRAWFGLISGGWFCTSLGLAVLLGDGFAIHWFLVLLAAALLGLMALPGWILMRSAPQD